MSSATGASRAESWPIAAAMLPFPPSQDASGERWSAQLAEVAYEGFTAVDITDSWVRPGDLGADRLKELRQAFDVAGLEAVTLSAIRRSVIDPVDADENLAYSHRTLEAAAALGCRIVSVGLHRPLLPPQRSVLWFWLEAGPADATDPETWSRAVARLQELGRPAETPGIELSVEVYEDTLLGTPESAVRLVHDIGMDSVGLNPDLGNLFRLHRPVEPFLSWVEQCLPVTNFWHIKSYFRDEDPATGSVTAIPAPMEIGTVDYRTAIRRAVELGFDGPFCVEHYGGDGLSVAAMNARYIRRMLAVATGEAAQSVLGTRGGAR